MSGSGSTRGSLSKRALGVAALAVIAAGAGAALILWSGKDGKDTPRPPVAVPAAASPEAPPSKAAVPTSPDAGPIAKAVTMDAGIAAAAPPVRKPAVAAKTKRGWVYLGDYEAGKWTTRYFDFPRVAPSRLVGQVVEPLGHANVRATMPSVVGEMGQTTGKVERGMKLTIDAVRPWEGTSYIWAEVHYARP